jgi:ribosomal protein L32
MRMPRYYVMNNGMGPYAEFYCDKCNREYRSSPSVTQTITDDVKRGALGGFLRNVPIVGNSMANNLENDRYRNTMTQQELEAAWGQVQQYFRECPTCHQVVCIPDFDEQSGFCVEDSPRRQQIAQAQAEQAAAVVKGFANAFGIGDAVKRATDRAAANMAVCPNCGTHARAGTSFCPNCGQPMTQPQPQAAAPAPPAAAVTCSNCGASVPPGQKFCGSCGAPVQPPAPQEVKCPNCGAMSATAFCGSCGTKVR